MSNLYSALLQSQSVTLRTLCACAPLVLTLDFALRRQAPYYNSKKHPVVAASRPVSTGEEEEQILGRPVAPLRNAEGVLYGYKLR